MATYWHRNLGKLNFTWIKEKKNSFKKKSDGFVCRENLEVFTFHFADRIWNIKLHFGHFSVVFILTITSIKLMKKHLVAAELREYKRKL